MEWRNTPWRQGHVIGAEDWPAVGGEPLPVNAVAVVVTHDCDLAAEPDVEPEIEVIVARRVAQLEGNYSASKNARRLHLPYQCKGEVTVLELEHRERIGITKKALEQLQPAGGPESPADRRTLQRWLGARYYRPAFPNKFEERLRTEKLDQKIAKILDAAGIWIDAILFDLQDDRDREIDDADEPYTLAIIVLYSTVKDASEGFKAAERVRKRLQELFKEKLYDQKKGWRSIELVDCQVVADTELSYAVWTKLQCWRLDHLSLRASPQQQPFQG
jgi:hypothetical protein